MEEKQKIILVVNGAGRTGKDTLCNIIKKSFGNSQFFVSSISSVDQIKHCAKILGWDGISKEEVDRKFLSDLKDLSTQYCDAPLKYEIQEIEKFNALIKPGILFIHIREPQEIKKLVDIYPEIKTILVRNKNVPTITGNHADANVENYNYDYYIDNNGTMEEYEKVVLEFIDNLINKGGSNGIN